MSAVVLPDLQCTSCGVAPRLPGTRSTWCRECKNAWQREYRRGVRKQKLVPPPIRTVAGCLIWQGCVHPETGYGQQTKGGVFGYAHRWAYVEANGPLAADDTVDHLCEVKLCLEPTHLDACSRSENTKRYYERRRSA